MNKIILPISFVVLFVFVNKGFAIQTSYQISPPPIPWYEFQKGQKDLKISATGMNITGSIDRPAEAPEAGGDIDVWGGSGGGFYRYAFLDKFAIDAGGTFLYAGGDVGDATTMDMWMIYIPFGLEFMAMRTDKVSIIIFGGMNFSWMNIGMDIDTSAVEGSLDLFTSTRGPQVGIQAALKFTDFVFTPFLMATRLSGSADVDYKGGGESGSISSGIPASTSVLYGIDIIYVPFDLSLSFIVQQGLSNGDNNGLKTHIFTLSYHFDLTENNDEVIEPVKTRQIKPGKQTGKTGVQ